MEVAEFSEIEAEFLERVNSTVWCNMATVDASGRPYSRIIHPVWEGSTGWILTHRHSHKARQLARDPHVSLSYIRGDVQRPVYVDCIAAWKDSASERERLWNKVKTLPEPLGFDPEPDFKEPSNPEFGLLELVPWRIVLVHFPAESLEAGQRVWRSRDAR